MVTRKRIFGWLPPPILPRGFRCLTFEVQEEKNNNEGEFLVIAVCPNIVRSRFFVPMLIVTSAN